MKYETFLIFYDRHDTWGAVWVFILFVKWNFFLLNKFCARKNIDLNIFVMLKVCMLMSKFKLYDSTTEYVTFLVFHNRIRRLQSWLRISMILIIQILFACDSDISTI